MKNRAAVRKIPNIPTPHNSVFPVVNAHRQSVVMQNMTAVFRNIPHKLTYMTLRLQQ